MYNTLSLSTILNKYHTFPCRLLSVQHRGRKLQLYSICGNPMDIHEFCVSGSDEFVRVYDCRKLSTVTTPTTGASDIVASTNDQENLPLKQYCPHHLVDSRSKPTVTACMYSFDGREIVASYNDELIYLFDTSHSTMADCIKVYEGHRNSATCMLGNQYSLSKIFLCSFIVLRRMFFFSERSQLFR